MNSIDKNINSCRICGNKQGNYIHSVREMMFGFRDEFKYIECGTCGCLQIEEIPSDLSYYYPKDYYSFAGFKTNAFKDYFKRVLFQQSMEKKTFLGGILIGLFGDSQLVPWIRNCKISEFDSILDVGCGQGRNLFDLYNVGFRNLTGVDAYIDSSISYGNGIRIHKKTLDEITEQYQLVMLHHSFEHMADPFVHIGHIDRITKPGGFVLIRMPIVPSYAWKVYGINWVQLDAPRHLYIYSLQGVKILLAKTHLLLMKVEYDSTEFQFIGSEQYKMDIPLWSQKSYYVKPGKSLFRKSDIKRYRSFSKELNLRGEGDMVCMYLHKSLNHQVIC